MSENTSHGEGLDKVAEHMHVRGDTVASRAAKDQRKVPRVIMVHAFTLTWIVLVLAAALPLVCVAPAAAREVGPSHANQVAGQNAVPFSVRLEGAMVSLFPAPPMAESLLAPSLVVGADERLFFLSIDLDEGWKTYWRHPGRFGLAPAFDWRASDNASSARVVFPAPVLFDEGDGLSIGYDAPTLWPVVVRPDDRDRPVDLTLSLHFGLCAALCVPAAVTLASPDETDRAGPSPAALLRLSTALAVDRQPLSSLRVARGDDPPRTTISWQASEGMRDAIAVVEGAGAVSFLPYLASLRAFEGQFPEGEAVDRVTIITRLDGDPAPVSQVHVYQIDP